MPPEPTVDPVVDAGVASSAADRLVLARAEVVDAANELVDHYVDAGDTSTQLALDTLADHAADTLRALADSLSDVVAALQTAAGGAAATDRSGRRSPDGFGGRRNLDGLGGQW